MTLLFSHIWPLSNYKLGTNHHVDETRALPLPSSQQLAPATAHRGEFISVILVVNQEPGGLKSCRASWQLWPAPTSASSSTCPRVSCGTSLPHPRTLSSTAQWPSSSQGTHSPPNCADFHHSPIPAPSCWPGPCPSLLWDAEPPLASPQVARPSRSLAPPLALGELCARSCGRIARAASGCSSNMRATRPPGIWEGPILTCRLEQVWPASSPTAGGPGSQGLAGKDGARETPQQWPQAPGKSPPSSCDAILPSSLPKVWNRPPPGSICFPFCVKQVVSFLLSSLFKLKAEESNSFPIHFPLAAPNLFSVICWCCCCC